MVKDQTLGFMSPLSADVILGQTLVESYVLGGTEKGQLLLNNACRSDKLAVNTLLFVLSYLAVKVHHFTVLYLYSLYTVMYSTRC